MFVNKIGNGLKNQQVFKGYQHEIDEIGQPVMRFNYPFDYTNDHGEVRFYNVKENKNKFGGYEVISDKAVGSYQIKENGAEVVLDDMASLAKNGPFAYRIVINNSEFADAGMKFDNYTIVTRKGTTPMVQGPAVLSMPDLHRPGAYYDQKTGKILYNPDKQKDAEGIIRNFANAMGGNLAGYEYDLDELINTGEGLLKDVKIFFSTPVAGGDNRSAFRYWNKNNMQIDLEMGTAENYDSFTKKMFQLGKQFVYDGTYTSEGLEGIHFQYALRWADKNPQTYYWFKMSGLKDGPLGYGVMPKHAQNIRFNPINAPSIIDPNTGKVVKNPAYDSNKEVLVQLYDSAQTTEDQLKGQIDTYKNIKANNRIAINSHDKTVPAYVFEVNPQEYTKRLQALVDYNKNNDNPIKLDSPEGVMFVCQFSNFKFIRKTEGGFVTWDANTDMVKMNYQMSGYDEKILMAIVDPSQREFEEKNIVRGTYETRDLTLQAARYWVGKTRRVQELYTAQTLKGANTKEAIDALIDAKKLPQEARLSKDAVQYILDSDYDFEPKEKLDKDEITVKSLMNLPLDSLEFGDNIVGVLSTSYFSNRATNSNSLGLTRFELMQQEEPHLIKEYAENYMKTNRLFKNELKDFANQVIEKVNETSSEKLLDEKGDYTEYGRYVIELLGQDIAKYAFLKSLGGNNLEAWTWEDGTITYDYKKIKENTTLKTLGIVAHNPADEAAELRKLMQKGLQKLDSSDINFVADSVSQKIAGTNTNSFKFAEAMVRKASLGLAIRLDAAKDVMDWDAVRNRDMTFDQAWDQVIEFWAKFVETVKKENPNAYVVAELTDIEDMMKATFGDNVNVNEDIKLGNKYKTVEDAMRQFYLKTGVTSEAGYSYTFTNLLKVFSNDFEKAEDCHSMSHFISEFMKITEDRSADYIRNLWTFADNHDKPSVIHGMALNMKTFHANVNENSDLREVLMYALTGASNYESLPLEAKFFRHKNMNYYRLSSSKAAAMSEAMRNGIDKLSIDDSQKNLLRKAVANLTNGYHLGEGNEFKLAFSDTKGLATIKGAVEDILTKAHLLLSPQEYEQIVNIAKNQVDKYFNETRQEELDRRTRLLLSGKEAAPEKCTEHDITKYHDYTTAIASAIRDAFHAVLPNADIETQQKFWIAESDYVKQYNKAFIEDKFNKLPFEESSEIAIAKDGYAARDFETVIKMIIDEAEYIAHKNNSLEEGKHIENSDAILAQLFRTTTEPAVKKAVMYATFLSALPGIPSTYVRDMLGALGFDEKAKNVFLQNRNTIPWSQLEEGPLKEYRAEILKWFREAINLRTLVSNPDRPLDNPINNGTPYHAETSNSKIPAILMQDGHGNASVSVFNTTNLHTDYTQDPSVQDNAIDHILFGFALAFPIGTEFKNVLSGDEATYVVKQLQNGVGIVNKNGGKIALNKATTRNGAMILKHIVFRGNPKTFNKQYNFVTNPYKKIEIPQEGQNLSLIAR